MKSLKNLPAEQQLKEIDLVAQKLGMPKPSERPVLEIKPGEDGEHKILELKRGKWSDEQPWFVIDEDGKLMVLSSAEAMMGIMNSLQHMGEEVFKARLERAIAKELPIDFHDVWTVAMHELQKRLKESGAEASNVNLENLVKSIKRQHPNLFYSLKDLQIDERDLDEAGL
ncbi:DUF2603 domain-containing protein [Hydrogenimonas cancrithermarum]|uniref:UPF0763 protein HCR_09500 n=1 Tax=Hydrogenimonas cancrithermarum TaxID=2993563 RepID=A0ABN6WUP5_9BACT|nr:DUF2603 domain-containing protein [Hydrogenimonas cancrithermarum]BDY12638.1 UPF0763 protein [Hydrogenimonas cancrithermarum]